MADRLKIPLDPGLVASGTKDRIEQAATSNPSVGGTFRQVRETEGRGGTTSVIFSVIAGLSTMTSVSLHIDRRPDNLVIGNFDFPAEIRGHDLMALLNWPIDDPFAVAMDVLDPVVADTEESRTWLDLARMYDGIFQPTTRQNARLQSDPDDYPLV